MARQMTDNGASILFLAQPTTDLVLLAAVLRWLACLLAVEVCLQPAGSQAKDSTNAVETPEARLARGDGYFASQEYNRAIVEYTRAIELKPDFAEAYNNRAYATYSKCDGTGDPLADLNRAISLRPDFAHAYNTRGCVHMAAGHPDEAIADFTRAIQLQPDYPRAYRNRGSAYLRKGRIGLALADLERAGGNPKRLIFYVFLTLAVMLALAGAVVYRWLVCRHPAVRQVSAEADGPVPR